MSCRPIELMGVKALPIGFAMDQLTARDLWVWPIKGICMYFGHSGLRLCPFELGVEFVDGLPIGR